MSSGTLRARPARSTPPPARRPAPRRGRSALIAFGVLVILAGGLIAAAFSLSGAKLTADPVALARVSTGVLAGDVRSVRATGPGGRAIPLAVDGDALTPRGRLVAPGERVTVDVVVRRPGALSWLLGKDRRERLVITAPAAHIARARLTVRRGAPVRVAFDQPVRAVAVGSPLRPTDAGAGGPTSTATLPVHDAAGATRVASAARSWERLGRPERVTWFPPTSATAALVSPAAGTRIAPSAKLRLTFSRPVAQALGAALPKLTPATPGHWVHTSDDTLTFTPSGAGAPLGSDLRVDLPRAVALVAPDGALRTVRSLAWRVPPGSTLRLQQLLADAGYLPVSWHAAGQDVARTPAAEARAAVEAPRGTFSWRYGNVPGELRARWHDGHANPISRAAIVAFQSEHGLAADGFAGPRVWSALLADAVAGKRTRAAYNYVYVHRDSSPQQLVLWHAGRTILTTPANTGVAAAPTELGDFPVFEHLRETTMKGTNPDGSHYNDPGIKWVSYFNGGDAIHAFDRASFGTPQSVGCVELPLAAAARVWPYTPIGTLVTIEH